MNQEQSLTRAGKFTSSEIYKLAGMGKRDMTAAELAARPKKGPGSSAKLIADPNTFLESGLTYIEDKNIERRLGRSLDTDTDSRPTQWGSLLEIRVLQELLGLEYVPLSTETQRHPEIDFWAGSPDAVKEVEGVKTVAEIKCPYTLRSYCVFADCSTIEEVREKHPDGEQYFWQTTSNAILTGATFGELIFYCPYKSEIQPLRELTQTLDTDEQSKYSWIYWALSENLPYLPDGGHYKNIHIIRWEIPEADKDFLTTRVLKAGSQLIHLQERVAA